MPDLMPKLALALLLAATPAAAAQTTIGGQISEDFEGYAVGLSEIEFGYFGVPMWTLRGGSVAAGTSGFPARSGSQVYRSAGTVTWLSDSNPLRDDYVYDITVYVSGSQPISFSFADQANTIGPPVAVSGFNAVQHAFVFSRDASLTKLHGFSITSAAPFSIDDLVVGHPAGISVPEPASWALLIAGFGLAGAAARGRRRHWA